MNSGASFWDRSVVPEYDELFQAARAKSSVRISGEEVDPREVTVKVEAVCVGQRLPIEIRIGALLIRHRLENSHIDYGDDLASFIARDLDEHPELAMGVYLRLVQPDDDRTVFSQIMDLFCRRARARFPRWAWSAVDRVDLDIGNDLLRITGECVGL